MIEAAALLRASFNCQIAKRQTCDRNCSTVMPFDAAFASIEATNVPGSLTFRFLLAFKKPNFTPKNSIASSRSGSGSPSLKE